MSKTFEVRVTGDAGTFVAAQISRDLLIIYELSRDEFVEVFRETENLPAPENLSVTLATWLYEFRRGYVQPVSTFVDTH